MLLLEKAFKKINYKAPEKEIWIWALVGLGLFFVGKWMDSWIFPLVLQWHTEVLNALVIFLTEYVIYFILGVFASITAYRVWLSEKNRSKLVPAIFAVMATGILAYIFKSFFGILRPFIVLGLEPLVEAGSYSFPSGHTAVAFALLIPFWRISKWLGATWFIFALSVGAARVYELVHFPSDIAAGIFLGGVVGAVFSHREVKKLITILWKELEFRRQAFHFIFGLLIVFAHWSGFIRLRFIAFILVFGLIVSIFSQYKKIPIISRVLGMFDRPRDKGFPGRGAFFFLLGVFLCLLLFPLKITYAAILILSIGDSLNHLFSSQVQTINLPWNRRRNIWGIFIGIAIGTFAAQFFVPWMPAFIATSVAIAAETIPWRIGKYYIDDNVVVPLVAGGVLWLLV